VSQELYASSEYRLGEERPRVAWIDYVMGCTAMLRATGYRIAGAELRIASDMPIGSGLSSSAALEAAVLRAFRDAFALAISDTRLAWLGQRAEVEFVGAPVSAMDQLLATLGTVGSALFVDLQSLEIHSIPMPPADLLVIASGVQRDHASGEYRIRRAECEEAARRLGVPTLRGVAVTDLAATLWLRSPLDRRTRHVVTENARVLAAVHAIENGDLATLGALLRAAHESMREDFDASLPAIDRLVEIANAEPAIYGARLTCGGFGGPIVALAVRGEGANASARIAAQCEAQIGHVPQVLVAGGIDCSRS
jgi:galactokinase